MFVFILFETNGIFYNLLKNRNIQGVCKILNITRRKFEIIVKNITHIISFISYILDVIQLVNSIQKLTPY